MPFIPHTPESLIRRSDSKDPATTCKGITSSGRPCRRAIGTSPQASPAAPPKLRNGVIAMLDQKDDEHDGAAAFFCWQHQDQAQALVSGDQDGRKANLVPVQPRTSTDTIAERLGLMDDGVEQSITARAKMRQNTRPPRKETLPKKWQNINGPLMVANGGSRKTKKKESSFLALFCCFRPLDDNPLPPARPQRTPREPKGPHNEPSKLPPNPDPPQPSHDPLPPPRSPLDSEEVKEPHSEPSRLPTTPVRSQPSRTSEGATGNSRPSVGTHQPSQTETLLSHISQGLSPDTTALLLRELAKPISPHDEEGYIYMFWLTKDALHPEVASSLLGTNLIPNGHRKSRVMQTHAVRPAGANPATILLKIGRTSNVQRRLNEWTRQCGYHLTLIRFYPYISSLISPSRPTSSTASPALPAKIPHAHKVERLIHIELADKRIKRNCESCGREHRELFEIKGNREALKEVDTVIRRWTTWGQRINAGT